MKDGCGHSPRHILHVDMDHFFSAIEERENPNYRGRPVVVGADPREGKGRGVVKTCNCEAREFGIHSGMPISQAWMLCPEAIYKRADYRQYREVSNKIMEILRGYSEKFQSWGLDEAFLDVTSQVSNLEDAIRLAVSIKHEILWHEKLTCSVGVAPNKLLAKIASDHEKPDALTVVTEDSVARFLSPLAVQKLLWIGKKTERKLNKMGIKTIGDLAACDTFVLVQEFGNMGLRYHQWAHGKYDSEVGSRRGKRKSVGNERTFSTNTNDCEIVFKRLDELCKRVYERIAKRNLLFKSITVKIRYQDFQTFTYGKTLKCFTNRLQDLQKTTRRLVRQRYHGGKKVRLIGVRVSNLNSGEGQKTLIQ